MTSADKYILEIAALLNNFLAHDREGLTSAQARRLREKGFLDYKNKTWFITKTGRDILAAAEGK